ncbi:NAD(P)H-dependent oxidoreductase [Microvirga sp. HBU67558]|uniref:NAD(P)H-dependent oxidoreductase n=1 Tax=Microvirga TaxID=186650 RepID=UPI001B368709|nr:MULTISPECIES: NAD(P)H-dependent oxidoreductase [unclassified Microvirga]MBQ0820309.1 NAD(P)H-dependent oxidoreductase [Microvirga sp. HBU67558]
MHALIVYAHPEPASFTGALKDRAVEALIRAGHTVEVSDLYAERFDPVAGRHDFTSVVNPERFHYQSEQEHAARNGTFAPEIRREQERVSMADLLVLQFPLWWGGTPAILKGWIDRVLAYGFAYVDGTRFDTGLFKGRRALFSVTTGGTPQRFTKEGVYGEIGTVLYPVERLLLQYMGFEVLPPFVAYAAPRVSDGERQAYLDNWEATVLKAAAIPVSHEKVNFSAAVGSGAWGTQR